MADNPFEERAEPNPFQDPSVTASAGQGANDNPFEAGGSQPPAPAPAPAAPAPTSTFGAYDTGAYGGGGAGASAYSASSSYGGVGGGAYDAPKPAAVTSNGAIASSVTVRELEERERQLKRREEELARRERELGASGGGRPKNWPIPGYWVIWHHDIDGDIRNDQVAAAVKMSYYSFLLLTLSLVYNFLFCATAAMFTGMESGFSAWLMALVYMLTGVPGAFYLWYKRLYSAAKNDSAMNYLWFFVVYLAHIAFCFYAFIAPTSAFSTPTYSLAGIMSTSAAMEKNKGTGGVYAFGVCLFGVTLIVSVNAVRMVYAAFRGGGHTLEEARQQARREGIRTAASSAV